MTAPKKVLYLVADDRYFCSHRLPLAVYAQQQGYQVFVAAPAKADFKRIQDAGLTFCPVYFDRGGLNPWHEAKTLSQIAKLYRQIRPDIVHAVALKPVLYGTLMGLWMRVPKIIAAISGLGAIFSQSHWLQKPVKGLLGVLLAQSAVQVIVQNPEDAKVIQSLNAKIDVNLILGAGVNLATFCPAFEPPGPITIIHVSRLLWNKGVKEFVEAARLLKLEGYPFHFRLVGEPDRENPGAIPQETLQEWHDEGIIEWIGYRSDIARLYQNSHIAVLASYYREGIPKSLLEAAACGKPIITCDMPGCRIIVQDKVNGYLIPPRNAGVLADKIKHLALDLAQRQQFGKASRALVEKSFSEEIIHRQTLELYC